MLKELIYKAFIIGAIALWLLSFPLSGQALAQATDVNEAVSAAQTSADTAFMLISAAMVLLMTQINITGYSGELR